VRAECVFLDCSPSSRVCLPHRYTRLLKEYPRGKYLGDFYAQFCRDVLNDHELAGLFGSEPNDDGGSAFGGGSVAGSQRSAAYVLCSRRYPCMCHSVVVVVVCVGKRWLCTRLTFVLLCLLSFLHRARSTGGGAGGPAASRRSIIPKTRTQVVAGMGRQFRIGMLLLIVIAAAAHVFETNAVTNIATTMECVRACSCTVFASYVCACVCVRARAPDLLLSGSTIVEAGKMSWACSIGALSLRDAILTPTDSVLATTITNAQTLKLASQTVFKASVEDLNAEWFGNDLTMTVTKPDGRRYTEDWNLWDSVNVLVADTTSIAAKAQNTSFASAYQSDVEWRFAMDNSMTTILPAMFRAAAKLEELTQEENVCTLRVCCIAIASCCG